MKFLRVSDIQFQILRMSKLFIQIAIGVCGAIYIYNTFGIVPSVIIGSAVILLEAVLSAPIWERVKILYPDDSEDDEEDEGPTIH